MTLTELLDTCRNLLDDVAEPFFWTEEELISYYRRSLEEFCSITKILRDSTTSVCCNITTTPNQYLYPLHESVLSVQEAKIFNENTNLYHITYTDLLSYKPQWQNIKGTPHNFITDYQIGYILFYPIPNKIFTINLTVVRLPINHNLLEIPAKYRPYLIDRILYYAYQKRDAETEDLVRMKMFEQKWATNLEKVKQDNLFLKYPDVRFSFHRGLF